MPPERHRGRRTAPGPQVQSRAEQEIRAAQERVLEARAAVDDETTDLAKLISEWMQEGVGTSEIGTWLTSPERPQGVSRQQVYKLVAERVDGKKLASGDAKQNGSPRPRPRPSRPQR